MRARRRARRAGPPPLATAAGCSLLLLLMLQLRQQLLDVGGRLEDRVLLELELRQELQPDLTPDRTPEVGTGRAQARAGRLPLTLVAEGRVVDPSMAQVRRHLD